MLKAHNFFCPILFVPAFVVALSSVAIAQHLTTSLEKPDRTVLPIPPPPFHGHIEKTLTGSSAESARAISAPAGAPNILLVLIDDAGYGQTGTFGGLIPTPTLDRLAARGLRYTRFHVTSLCSPTRAALLTGRNHHAVHMGTITNWGSDFPAYTGSIPKSAALISKVLNDNGYATASFGKWHLIPESEMNEAGTLEHWPTHQGFDYYYGFLGGQTDQWYPELVEGAKNTEIEVPLGREGHYTLNDALADRAIGWIKREHSEKPDHPFFIYYAPGATHVPQQAPPEWIEKFKGKFDMGWDEYREIVLARQKQLGVVPKDTVLTPRPPELQAWNSLSPDEKKVASRMMEVFGGYMAQTDYDLGRVVDTIQAMGELDNTLILVIAGDNGAAIAGGPLGTNNNSEELNGDYPTAEQMLPDLAKLGGPSTAPSYPAAWGWAGNTPFQWGKEIASYLGGTRNPLIVSWPSHIHDVGTIRDQFTHVIDVAPTLLEVAGLPQPRVVDGVEQQPVDGISFAYTFDNPEAPSRRQVQYFEMVANRAIYSHGWMATSNTNEFPWLSHPNLDILALPWQLYHLDTDYSEAHNVAAQNPARLASLKSLFDEEAKKYNVYPLDARSGGRFPHHYIPHYNYYAAGMKFYTPYAPPFASHSYTITVNVELGKAPANGVIFAQGANYGGFSLYMQNGRLFYLYNNFRRQITNLAIPDALGPGQQQIKLRVDYDGGGVGQGATVTLSVDGHQSIREHLSKTVRYSFFDDSFDIGEDGASPVGDYAPPFPFTGKIKDIHIDMDPSLEKSSGSQRF